VKLTLERSVALGSTLIMAVSLAAIWVVYESFAENLADRKRVEQSQHVLREMATLLGEMIDVETGTRGFLISGQTRHLGPYDRSLPRIPATLRRLEEMFEGYPEQRQRIVSLRPLIEAQLEILDKVITGRRRNELSSSEAIELTDRGKDLMDQIRAQIDGTENVARQRLNERMALAASSAWRASALLWTAMALIISILALSFRQVASEMKLRRGTERALRESEQRFRGAFEGAAFGMAIGSLEGRWTEVNPALQEILGHPGEELIGASVEAAFEFENDEAQQDLKKSLLSGVNSYNRPELPFTKRNGQRGWARLSVSTVRDHVGNPVQLIALVEDITTQRQAELVQKYAAIVQSSDDAIISKTIEGKILSWNPGAERMYGYSSAEAVGRSITMLIPPDEPYEFPTIMERIARGERVSHYETVRQRKDGGRLHVSVSVSPIMDASGKVTEAADVTRDMSERKEMEEVLAHRAHLLDQAFDPIFAWEPGGAIAFWNEGARRLYGYEALEAIGKVSNELLLTVFPTEWKECESVLRERGTWEGEVRHRTKDGRWVTVDSRMTLVKSPGRGAQVLEANRDLTKRKEAETLLEHRAEELARSNAELEQFAYVASHDLQEPLRMVASYLELLAERYKGRLDEKADRYIDYAIGGAVRMKALLDGLLAFARVATQGRDFEFVDSRKALTGAITNLDTMIRELGAVVTFDPLPIVLADPIQMVQLFQNLIGNALKFCHAKPPRIHVSAQCKGDKWTFWVRDNGIGIAPQHRERIFQIFQRLHGREEFPGTGVGLSICKKVVERHGGRIWVESQPGEGSTFCFTIPSGREQRDQAVG
jgi:PAS domain S-box-containing protein